MSQVIANAIARVLGCFANWTNADTDAANIQIAELQFFAHFDMMRIALGFVYNSFSF